MSIRAMTYVWAHSRQKGSALLVLLAVADCAHDDGTGAYPSMKTLAEKTRLSERNVQYVIKALIESGELELIDAGGGRGKTPSYRVVVENGAKSAPIQPAERVKPASPIRTVKGAKAAPIDDEKGATQRQERVQPSVLKGATQRQSDGEPLRRGRTPLNRPDESENEEAKASAAEAASAMPADPEDSAEARKNAAGHVYALVDAFAFVTKRTPSQIQGRDRSDTAAAFRPIAKQTTTDDVVGCAAYLRSDPFWKEPGKLTARKLAQTIPEWIADGRPPAVAPRASPNGRGSDYADRLKRDIQLLKGESGIDGDVYETTARVR